jgi:hypothetical protein
MLMFGTKQYRTQGGKASQYASRFALTLLQPRTKPILPSAAALRRKDRAAGGLSLVHSSGHPFGILPDVRTSSRASIVRSPSSWCPAIPSFHLYEAQAPSIEAFIKPSRSPPVSGSFSGRVFLRLGLH